MPADELLRTVPTRYTQEFPRVRPLGRRSSGPAPAGRPRRNGVTTTAKAPVAVILLIEDDPGDQILTQEAFRALRVPHRLYIVSDGKEALEYLYRKGPFASEGKAPRPDLILLDLNIPRVNGQQVAAVLGTDPGLRTIPIVVLTTSRREEDVLRTYSRGVARFVSKPLDFQHFIAVVQELEVLIKFVVTQKSLPVRSRLTHRQVLRWARRKKQLQRGDEEVFNRYMGQIDNVAQSLAASPPPDQANQEAAASGLVAGREQVLDLARRILRGRREESLMRSANLQSQTAGSPRAPEADTWTSDLRQLARRLTELEQEANNYRPARAWGQTS